MEVHAADGDHAGCTGRMHRFQDWYAHHVVERPRILMTVGLLIPIIFSAVGIIAFPITIDATGGSFVPKSSVIGQREDSLLRGEEMTRFNPLRDASASSVSQAQQSDPSYVVGVDYWAEDGSNIFTAERIAWMQSLEQKIIATPNYTSFCVKPTGSDECLPPISLIAYFYADDLPGCPGKLLPNGSATTLVVPINTTLTNLINPTLNETYCGLCLAGVPKLCQTPSADAIDFAVDNGFGYSVDPVTSSSVPSLDSEVTKSIFQFGLPLEGFNSSEDRRAEQIAILEDFVKTFLPVFDEENDVGITVFSNSPVGLTEHFNTIIFNDSILVVISIGIVYLYVWFHTRSFWIASFGILHVILSFPCAYLIMEVAMNTAGMSVLNFMSLFIILGIGADDIFIFVDAWKQSAHINFGKIRPTSDPHSSDTKAWFKKRLAWAYGRSTRAMFITSLTTGCAFLMNLSSSIVTIQVFGFFTAMMVFINYLEVISVFPAVVMTHTIYLRDSCCIKACNAAPLDQSKEEISATDIEVGKDAAETSLAVDVGQLRVLERWFHETYAPFIIKYRIALAVLLVGFFGMSIGFATQLKQSEVPTQWLPSDDPIQIMFSLETETFKAQTMVQQIWWTEGLGLIDRSGVNVYNADEIGTATFVDLDLSPEQAQLESIAQCNRLRTKDYVVGQQVLCPMEEFRTFVQDELGEDFPVPEALFLTKFANFTQWYETENGPAKDYSEDNPQTAGDRQSRRAFEIGNFYQTIRWSKTEPMKLLYIANVINCTMTTRDSGAQIRPVYNYWEDVVAEENALPSAVEATLNSATQSANQYVEMELQDTLLNAALIGIGGSLGLAFGIILITTRDVVISILSIISIGGVVVSLICMLVWFGWSLGVIESIAMTILVGLSVDYTIHLAQAYRESAAHNRRDRLIDCLTSMGISVLSASATSILSAVVLFFTTISFFVKFGIFIGVTIALSTFYSFGLFVVMLAFVGRNESKNDFASFWNWIRCKETPPKEDLRDEAHGGVSPSPVKMSQL